MGEHSLDRNETNKLIDELLWEHPPDPVSLRRPVHELKPGLKPGLEPPKTSLERTIAKLRAVGNAFLHWLTNDDPDFWPPRDL